MIRSGYPSLLEFTRPNLLMRTKKDNPSKFSKRTESGENWSLIRVDTENLATTKNLLIEFSVNSKYIVQIVLLQFEPTLDKYVQGKFSNNLIKAISSAIMFALKYNHIQVSCTCPDFKYRHAYMATQKGYGYSTNEDRPASRTNPKNKGALCKHEVKILKIPSKWKAKVVTALKSYLSARNNS